MRLAVFDIDGTLTLGDGLGTRCFFEAFEDVFGAGSVDRRLETYAESTDGAIAHEAALRVLGHSPSSEQLDRFKDTYLGRLGEEIARRGRAYRPLPGADGVMSLLASRAGWHVAIATGNWKRAASLKLECAGIGEPDVAACSEDGRTRSAILASAVARATARAGIAAFERVVYVGDQPWDLAAAREVGAAFVGMGSDERGRRLEKAGARIVLGSYADGDLFLAALEDAAAVVEAPGRGFRPGPSASS